MPNQFITYFSITQLSFLPSPSILALGAAKIVYLIQAYATTFPFLYTLQQWQGESAFTIETVKLQITTPPYIDPSVSFLILQ
jgi:hypothetical protein